MQFTQHDLTALDKELEDATRAMAHAKGESWRHHMPKISALIKRRIEMVRPEAFEKIAKLLGAAK